MGISDTQATFLVDFMTGSPQFEIGPLQASGAISELNLPDNQSKLLQIFVEHYGQILDFQILN